VFNDTKQFKENTLLYPIMPPKYKKYAGKPKTYEFNKGIATHLLIVESPSKCQKIEGYLGSQYKCIASKGHIRLLGGLTSIKLKENYEPIFSISPSKSSHVKWMKNAINQFPKSNIILAADDDREGEAIAWHICEVFDLPVDKTQRIVFHEITKQAIDKAVSSTGLINMDLVRSQHARQVLDILVGFKISPLLWKYLYNDKDNGLSAGRCQTPALRLVYDNEMEKKNSGGIERSYKTTGTFTSRDIDYVLSYNYDNEENLVKFLEKSKNYEHKISLGSPKCVHKAPPQPFSTSNLLQVASNNMNMSPKETMQHCQSLYQEGLITYMRTESTKYSKEFIELIGSHIDEKYGEKYKGDTEKITNYNNTDPHEAIRVTDVKQENLTVKDRKSSLYKLIWNNTYESCMSTAEYEVTQSTIIAPEKHHYRNSIEIPKFLGWKRHKENIKDNTISQNDGKATLLYVKSLISGSGSLQYNKIRSSVSFTNKHSHYSESGLIKKLENLGIGRPSTFAMLLETIINKGYVNKMDIDNGTVKCSEYLLENENLTKEILEKSMGKECNKLVIQKTGILIIEFLIKYFESMFSYGYTKTMEDKLDVISKGEMKDWYMVCDECHELIKELSKPISKLTKETYKLDDIHEVVFVKYGPTIRYKDEDGKYAYKKINPCLTLELDKLKTGGYTVNDLLLKECVSVGKWEEQEVYIREGRYGRYIEYGDTTKSITTITKPISEITMNDLKKTLEGKANPSILRTLNADFSVRKGKHGNYVFYKTKNMKQPKFLNINKFKQGYASCSINELVDWLCLTYKIDNTY
jgi:DNA topoisomerase-1